MPESYEWYSPAQISFQKSEVIWLIKHLATIRTGSWPSDHKESGYTGSKGKTNKRAPFDTPACVFAELEKRIELAGIDGILLEFYYSQEVEDQLSLQDHIAQAMRLDLDTIDRRIEQALRFVSGYHRKSRNYKQFRNHQKGDHR